MPAKDLQRWNQDGAKYAESAEDAGYSVDLQYVNDPQTQRFHRLRI